MFARRKPASVDPVEAPTLTLREVDPELGRLQDKNTELNLRAAALLEEIGKLARAVRDAESTAHLRVVDTGPKVSEAAAALLEGVIETHPPPSPRPADPRRHRLEVAQAERAAALEAIAALEPAIRERTVQASWVICHESRPAYDALVASLKEKVEAVLSAATEAEAFLDAYRREGVLLGRLGVVRTDDALDDLKTLLRRIDGRQPTGEP